MRKRNVFLFGFFETTLLACLAYGLATLWYPDFYLYILEADIKLYVIFFVLFLLGPVLYVLFYKDDFSTYFNDLSVLYLIKLSALFLALHFLYENRPVLVVYAVDRFVVVQANQVRLEDIPPGIVGKMLNSKEPPVIAAQKIDKNNIDDMIKIMSGAPDIEYRPLQYEAINYQIKFLFDRFCETDSNDQRQNFIGLDKCDSVEIPLAFGDDEFSKAVFNLNNLNFVKVLDISPW